jgi:hypothetical protein
MIPPVGIKRRCPALDAVDDVAFAKKKFGKIGAVLDGDAGD